MRIDKTLGKYQLVPLVFMEDAVAANQTNAQLAIVDNGTAQLCQGYAMPFAGEIVGISYHLSGAATAGSMTIGPTIDGTEAADPTVTVTTAQSGSDTCNRGKATFAKNQVIGAEITTDATWDGTARDLAVIVWVVLALSGI